MTEEKALGKALLIEFPPFEMSQSSKQQFLDGDFTIIKDVRALPHPVLEMYIEQGGSRLLMVNPGKKFEVGDVIYDESLPQKRLIFAGILGDKCFVRYEQGGYTHMYIVALFDVTSANSMKPLWRGYCDGPAASLNDLRSKVVGGYCR